MKDICFFQIFPDNVFYSILVVKMVENKEKTICFAQQIFIENKSTTCEECKDSQLTIIRPQDY